VPPFNIGNKTALLFICLHQSAMKKSIADIFYLLLLVKGKQNTNVIVIK